MKKLLCLMLLVLCFFSLNAQHTYEFHMGLSSPSGDFADDDVNNAISNGSGCAASGINLGLKYFAPTKSKGLSMFIGVDFLYNGLTSDFKDFAKEEMLDGDVTYPKYINVPVLVGLNQSFELTNELQLFGEAGLGLNFFKITNLSMSGSEYLYDYGTEIDYSATMKFDSMVKLCCSIGAGLIIRDKYTLSLNYKPLGAYKMNYTSTYKAFGESETHTGEFAKSLDVKAITFTAGVFF